MPLLKPRTLTLARLAANRRSAQKSTGPRTAAGKKWSRLNALRNGHASKTYRELIDPLLMAPLGRVRETAASILTPEELAHPFIADVIDYFCGGEQLRIELALRKFNRKIRGRTKPKSALKSEGASERTQHLIDK